MPTKKKSKKVKVHDLKPKKDAKAGLWNEPNQAGRKQSNAGIKLP